MSSFISLILQYLHLFCFAKIAFSVVSNILRMLDILFVSFACLGITFQEQNCQCVKMGLKTHLDLEAFLKSMPDSNFLKPS